MQGKITKIIAEKGYGFIETPSQGADIFFHCTALQDRTAFDTLFVGETVEFELVSRKGKLRAEGVRRISSS